MQPIKQALDEIRALHEQVTRQPAPEIAPQSFLPIPPGCDPVAFALEEVSRLKQWLAETNTVPTQAQPTQWVPRANVFAGESRLCYIIEIPGIAKGDLAVTATGGELVVRGQREPQPVAGGMRPMLVEQAWGAFERRFPLPGWCNPESITARCSQGVLEIEITRSADEGAGQFSVDIG